MTKTDDRAGATRGGPDEIRPASVTSLADLAAHQALLFEGYPVPVTDDPKALADRVRAEHIDLHASFEIYRQGELQAQALIARRGRRARVAGLGVPPTARRSGWARVAMRHLIEAADQRRDIGIQLEVLTTNHAALRLYTSLGFTPVRSLLGYELDIAGLGRRPVRTVARRISVPEVASVLASEDLPWQIEAATLYGLSDAWFACTNGPSYAVASADGNTLTLRALVTRHGLRRQGHARDLLRQLPALASGAVTHLKVPPLAPAPAFHAFAGRVGLVETGTPQTELTLNRAAAPS